MTVLIHGWMNDGDGKPLSNIGHFVACCGDKTIIDDEYVEVKLPNDLAQSLHKKTLKLPSRNRIRTKEDLCVLFQVPKNKYDCFQIKAYELVSHKHLTSRIKAHGSKCAEALLMINEVKGCKKKTAQCISIAQRVYEKYISDHVIGVRTLTLHEPKYDVFQYVHNTDFGAVRFCKRHVHQLDQPKMCGAKRKHAVHDGMDSSSSGSSSLLNNYEIPMNEELTNEKKSRAYSKSVEPLSFQKEK